MKLAEVCQYEDSLAQAVKVVDIHWSSEFKVREEKNKFRVREERSKNREQSFKYQATSIAILIVAT